MAITEAPGVRRKTRAPILDPSKPRGPQIAVMSAQLSAIFGGPIFGLIGMIRYPMLIPDRVLALGCLASLIVWSAVSYYFIRTKPFPKGASTAVMVQMHLGLAVCATGWTIGALDIANGYATPVVTRDVPIAYKRASWQTDPKQRSYYVGARLWSSPGEVTEITVPRALFDRLDVPNTDLETSPPPIASMPDRGVIRLLVGRGRLGVEWLHGIAPLQPDARQGDNAGS